LIVLAEIFICAFAWLHPLALLTGKFIHLLIIIMNTWIERIESIPYSLWDGLQISLLQTIFLYLLIAGFGYWIFSLNKKKAGLWVALAGLLLFMCLRSQSFIQASKQRKLIVYNISKHAAIDIIDGRNYYFIGDSALLEDDFLRNFNLKPSRILHRITQVNQLPGLLIDNNYISWQGKRILIIDQPVVYSKTSEKMNIDLLVLSKKANLSFFTLSEAITMKQIVFDGSLSYNKVKTWMVECDSLHLPYYNVADKGTYIMNLNQ